MTLIFTQSDIKQAVQNQKNNSQAKMSSYPSKEVDLSIIKEIVGDDHEALVSVLREFIDTAQLEMDTMEQAYASNDLQRLADLAHKLRSTFRYFGAFRVEKLLIELETTARKANEKSTLQTLISDIIGSYQSTLIEVRGIIADDIRE